MQGVIIKALSGFYYVDDSRTVTACRGRGKLRHAKVTPLVGDRVEFTPLSDGQGALEAVLPRKNQFHRPAVANIDQLVIIASGAIPVTDPFLIDRVAAIADSKDALDVIHTVRFQTGRNNMLLERGAFVPEMFDLSTGVVTQVLKAFVDEKMRLAIVGDLYDCYQSSMRDVIFTCNRSNQVSFWETEAEGLAWLNKK